MAKTEMTQMTEEQMVGLVRNALLVAGYEMGQTGDHWPVINHTILQYAKDYEEARIQEDVDAELKTHLYDYLEQMEKGVMDCSDETRAKVTPKLKQLRDVYDSYFMPLDPAAAEPVQDDEIPVHMKRAETIIASLRGES